MPQVTDVEYLSSIKNFLDSAYSEISKYEILLGEDFLTTGVTRFLKALNDARGWSSRVLGLLMDARRHRDKANQLAKGKKTLFEYACIEYIKNERPNMPAGLDGHERKALAQLINRDKQDDAQEWEGVVSELRTMIEVLEDKHKDLLSAKQDLRAQLWAVKLQGILGELVSEARESEETSPNWNTEKVVEPPKSDIRPSFAEGKIRSEFETVGLSVDELLGKGVRQ